MVADYFSEVEAHEILESALGQYKCGDFVMAGDKDLGAPACRYGFSFEQNRSSAT
jgi:hypothetical protein